MVLEYTLEEIDRVAEQLIDSFTHSIVAMSGQMGSGKTTLVKRWFPNWEVKKP